ncbi:hypothetical protein MKEN_01430100 [Mycena kentingensis (nom. inval.)]|nr:hypothetical protein MKEN_01430100 [Mycena kentingensis (nom. inval.)]
MAQAVSALDDTLHVDLHRTSFAGTAALVWEHLITIDQEVQYIWPKPKTSWVKNVYLFLRYFSLAVQLTNRVLAEMVYSDRHLSLNTLRGYYASLVVIGHACMSCVELVMYMRVYALYHRSRAIAHLFVGLWIAETIVVFIGLAVTLPRLSATFEKERFVTNAPGSFAYLAISTLVSQFIILVLTFAKYKRGEWQGTTLGSLLMRDGTIVYVIFFMSTITAAIYSLQSYAFGMAEFSWLLTIISTVGCRLILNMQRLAESSRPRESSYTTTSMELTTLHRSTLYA